MNTTNSPEAQPEPEFETDGTKGQMLVDAIDKAVTDDPTRFTTRSFAVIENAGHGIRLVNRSDARYAISIPWADLFALREVINCVLKDDPRRTYQPEAQPQGAEKTDFSCRVCGVQCAIAPDPPDRAVCPEHCEDHNYVYSREDRGTFCEYCWQEAPRDYYLED